MTIALRLAAFFVLFGIGRARPLGNTRPQSRAVEPRALASPNQAAPRSGAPCDTSGIKEIKIECNYEEGPGGTTNGTGERRIAINRAEISFETKNENYMRVELTFTNSSTVRVSNAQTVYLAIDDDANRNVVRRILSHVDFTKLEPGKKLTFSERLLIGVLRPGNYTVHLWIPNPDPALKFDSASNLLLDNTGVPDKRTGRNNLATFTILH